MTAAKKLPCFRCSDCDGQHHWMVGMVEAREEPEHLAAQVGLETWDICKHCDAWRPDAGSARAIRRIVVSHDGHLVTCTKCRANLGAGHGGLSAAEIKAFIEDHAHKDGSKRAPVTILRHDYPSLLDWGEKRKP